MAADTARPHPAPGDIVVVMGVSASGKSTVARALAHELRASFLDGDDFHAPASRSHMAAGRPLGDAEREGWLAMLAARLAQAHGSGEGVVLACSALKRRYRDVLRQAAPQLKLVLLHGSRELLGQRITQRVGHTLPPSLLDSQLAALEPPQADEAPIVCDIRLTPQHIFAHILQPQVHTMVEFHKVVLYTDGSGRARFRDESIPLDQGTPQARLSAWLAGGGCQLRHSPVGFRSDFHCTSAPQWVFILGGRMEIGLRDGSSRIFEPGQHFYSADTLPPGATFDDRLHGHRSAQVGTEPLVTLFVRG